MVLRIERDSSGGITKLRLIGRLRSDGIEALRQQMLNGATPIVLDLEDVTLVDATAVFFLAAWESEGVTLRHCSPYVREWIHRERDGGLKRPTGGRL